jgi:hypothetical protein
MKKEGLKYEQSKQVEASTYQILADAYRKSGVVTIGVENGIIKGLSGDRSGHTYAQAEVARRQYVSFEDSKRNHAVNASSQTIGQLVAAEAPLDNVIIQNYNKAMEYLLTDSVPVVPGGPAQLDGVNITWDPANGTDTVDADCNLTDQVSPEFVTLGAQLDRDKNYRNGDFIIIRVNGGEYYGRHTITVDDMNLERLVLIQFPSVDYSSSGSETMYYDLELYVQDMAGNTSTTDTCQLKVKYNPIR